MNLDSLNLVELNAQEISIIDGGCWDCNPILHAAKDLVEGFLSAF
jgi:hypothetical protein